MRSSDPALFIVDGMLRGLVRWLRFMGFQSWYIKDISELAGTIQQHPGAVFLTASSRHLQQNDDIHSLMLKEDSLPGQLHELHNTLDIFSRINFLSLCSICNTALEQVSLDQIRQVVPPKILQTQNHFWQCPACGKVYWQGGHITRLTDKLNRMGIPIQQSTTD